MRNANLTKISRDWVSVLFGPITRQLVFMIITSFMYLKTPISTAQEIVVASQGKSPYRIVVPQENDGTSRFVGIAAGLLQYCIKESTGVKIPIVKNNVSNITGPAIFLGASTASEKAGINIKELKGWEYIIKVNDKNIFLVGHDSGRTPNEKGRDRTQYYLGTFKAVTTFLEKFVGVRFVMPGKNGIAVPQKDAITVPNSFALKVKPHFSYCTGRSQELVYDIANNFFSSLIYGGYGGHSHNIAIPFAKYYKTNPEYFALIRGKRHKSSSKPQYCLSNPKVQELIYKELLNKLDQGYQWAQLAQSDGFIPCECNNCMNMYGIKSKNGGRKGARETSWGEKLWIMHRKMAEQLMRDRPNKKVVIIAYGPTVNPPKTFNKFPSNVIIELAKYAPKDLKKWEKFNIDKVAYVYNWGAYHLEGYTPKRTPEFCRKQLDCFRENKVKGIYTCGFGFSFGLEGPVYYVYGKLLENRNLSPDVIVDNYCQSAFGKAGRAMKKFYELLHLRLKKNPKNTREDDWNDIDLLDGKTKIKHKNIELLASLYPDNVICELEEYLANAEKSVEGKKQKLRLKLVRLEFDYLKKTVKACQFCVKYFNNPSLAILCQIRDAIKERNNFIASIPSQIKQLKGWRIRIFNGAKKATLITGGRLKGPLAGPFVWNLDLLIKNGIVPGAAEIHVPKTDKQINIDGIPDELIWKNSKSLYLRPATPKQPKIKTCVHVAYDNDALYVFFRMEQLAPELRLENADVFLGADKNKKDLLRYHAKLSSARMKAYGPNISNINKYVPCKLISSANIAVKRDIKNNTAGVEIRIPFSTYSKRPKSGSIWYGNFSRRHKGRWRMTWEPNAIPYTRGFQNFGKLIFE